MIPIRFRNTMREITQERFGCEKKSKVRRLKESYRDKNRMTDCANRRNSKQN